MSADTKIPLSIQELSENLSNLQAELDWKKDTLAGVLRLDKRDKKFGRFQTPIPTKINFRKKLYADIAELETLIIYAERELIDGHLKVFNVSKEVAYLVAEYWREEHV